MATIRPAPESPDDSITGLLTELRKGNRDVESRLVSRIYDELRRVAAGYMRRERPNHTLQATALVNEAYLRLMQTPQIPWENRAHFLAIAARLMRQVLVDHARAHGAGKRGRGQQQVTLDELAIGSQDQPVDILALHEALDRLAAFDPRQSRIVELHFFGGLPLEEIAFVLDVSRRTVERDWRMARAWLRMKLSDAR
jgi:RNA polymerase sigma factor, sigma-70 family/RNA polymerase sigma factor, TIGR02999 family